MYGSDILRGISKVPFEIPHKISDPYIERYDFYTTSKFSELLDLRAHTRYWNAPLVTQLPISCTKPSIKISIYSMALWNTHKNLNSTSIYLEEIHLKLTRQIWGIWKLRPAYSPETPNLGQNRDVLYRVTLKFDGWPWKTIGHLSFAVSSFVQHFIAIGEFKLELQSGNAQFGWNSTIFFSHVTLQFEVWPWKTIGHLFYAISSFVHHFVAISEFKLELQSRNGQSGSKSTIFLAVRPCNLAYDLEKQ